MTRHPWTQEEIAILRRTYPQGCRAAEDALPNRTYNTICVKAASLGIRVEKPGRAPYRRRGGEQIAKPVATSTPAPEETRNHRAKVYAHNGGSAEWGTTAGTKPGLEPVPDSAQALPWVTYPRDPRALRVLAEYLEHQAARSPVIAHLGTESLKFFRTQAAYFRVLADNLERAAA